MAKFIILALPRSRTKWTSEWLSFAGRNSVGHDLAVECSSIQDFEDSLESVDGTVETGAVLGWKLLREWYPDLRMATITRPWGQVVNSFLKLGLSPNTDDLEARALMLEALASQPGVMNIDFNDLSRESVAANLWEFLLRKDFDYEWWAECNARNIQIDMAERLTRLRANALRLNSLRDEILSETRSLEGLNNCHLN